MTKEQTAVSKPKTSPGAAAKRRLERIPTPIGIWISPHLPIAATKFLAYQHGSVVLTHLFAPSLGRLGREAWAWGAVQGTVIQYCCRTDQSCTFHHHTDDRSRSPREIKVVKLSLGECLYQSTCAPAKMSHKLAGSLH